MVSFLDTILVVFGIIFYSLTAIVFLLRAYEKSNKELQLKYIFSLQIIPLSILALMNYIQNQVRQASARAVNLVSMISQCSLAVGGEPGGIYLKFYPIRICNSTHMRAHDYFKPIVEYFSVLQL